MLILGHDEAVADWAADKANVRPFLRPLTAIGISDTGGSLTGAAVFNVYTGDDVEVTFIGSGTVNRAFFKAVAEHVFVRLGCKRCSATTRADNIQAIRLIELGGAVREGLARKKFGDCDGILYGMLREECRWL